MGGQNVKIVFFGSDNFSVPSLKAIAELPIIDKLLVVTYPDRPQRHKKESIPTPVKKFAIERGLALVEVSKKALKSRDFYIQLEKFSPELGVVASFTIIPSAIISLPSLGFINVHPSLLPAYRGAAPVNWAIIRGEKKIGVTTFIINDKVDSGEILSQEPVTIKENETAGELRERLSYVAASLLTKTISLYLVGKVKSTKQMEHKASRAPKIKPKDRLIDWHMNAEQIKNLILGLSPNPGALSRFRGRDIKFLRARLSDRENDGNPGEIIAINSDGIVVCTGKGSILLGELQPASSRVMSASDFVNGYRPNVGEKFG